MEHTANILASHVDEDITIVAGKVRRAIESASIIANKLNQETPKSYPELYAAEEDGRFPDAEKAYTLLQNLHETTSNVIAVVSREYIETLPHFVNKNIFKKSANEEKIHLDRGEALIIDTKNKKIRIIS